MHPVTGTDVRHTQRRPCRSRSSPHPREYSTRRLERTGSVVWDAVDRVPLGLSLYHITAADTDVLRITVYSGGRKECDESAHADELAADRQGGTDGSYQWRDVPVNGRPPSPSCAPLFRCPFSVYVVRNM